MTLNEVVGRLMAYLGEQTLPDTGKIHLWMGQAKAKVHGFIVRNNPWALLRQTTITVGEGDSVVSLPRFSVALEAFIQQTTDDDETWLPLPIKPYRDTHNIGNPGQRGFPKHLFVAPGGRGNLWPVPDRNYRIRFGYAAPLDDFIWENPNGDWDIPPEYEDLFIKELAYAYAFAYIRDFGARLSLIKQDIVEAQEALKRTWPDYGGKKHIRRNIYHRGRAL